MDFLSPKARKYLLLTLPILMIWVWYLLQSDEKYLKKQTRYLISLTAVPSPLSKTKAIHRVNKIASFLRFNVNFQGQIQGRAYTTKNLQQIKSFLLAYFIQAQTALWKEEDLNVTLNEKEKIARISLTLNGNYNKKTLQCRLKIQWQKEKKWLIYSIKVPKCFSLNSL